jgi:hypothetical protein
MIKSKWFGIVESSGFGEKFFNERFRGEYFRLKMDGKTI